MSHAQPSLTGPRLVLRPLLASDAAALVEAASDGELWKLPFIVVPSADTVDAYIGNALAGRDAGTVMPFATVLRETDKHGFAHRKHPEDELRPAFDHDAHAMALLR
jgi:RimJ/RimL family protein N-acetyltransferase